MRLGRRDGADGRRLDGVLARPASGAGPFGLVVFVHGDGPVDATHETFYRPLWESFARAGYASLSFSKPGVGGSEGDWLDQSMADRAEETLAAVAWARARPDVDGRRIGLWGASQAGWVLPKVAARDRSLRFVIAVSPAVNWLRQGRFHLLARSREDGASEQEVRAALRRRETTLRLLRRGASPGCRALPGPARRRTLRGAAHAHRGAGPQVPVRRRIPRRPGPVRAGENGAARPSIGPGRSGSGMRGGQTTGTGKVGYSTPETCWTTRMTWHE
ncbi:alpha/beta hydrolase family protein [Streptomyces sp. NPDC053079]|uniref:alpha/beta hydrolase family protein n=1 Tax=Streptomyces sp. NPDC053079 TaxID=3365697 RepID=UPI0037D8F535